MMRVNIIAGFLIASIPHIAVASFQDVDAGHMYSEAIEYAHSKGIVQGYDDGTYRPDQHLTRAEFVKIIVTANLHLIGQPLESWDEGDESEFSKYAQERYSDVINGAWYLPYLGIATSTKFVEGDPGGTFRPDNTINYAEAATIIARSFSVRNERRCELPNDEELWYANTLEDFDMFNLKPPTVSGPSYFVTRGEMVDIIYRLKDFNSSEQDTIEEYYNDIIRCTDLKGIGEAIQEYVDDTGRLPTHFPETETEMCAAFDESCAGLVDLSVLYTTIDPRTVTDSNPRPYLNFVRADPDLLDGKIYGSIVTRTGYAARVSGPNQITLSALNFQLFPVSVSVSLPTGILTFSGR